MLLPHIKRIKELIDDTGARTILDYGCGKGMQYDPHHLQVPGAGVWDGVIDYWDIDEVCCYDPCYERYSKLPQGELDGVISTDVLEHCVVEDIAWIVAEMFSYANQFVFANIACYPAIATLPNGENAHCTVRPATWWQPIFAATAAQYPGVEWSLAIVQQEPNERGLNTITAPLRSPLLPQWGCCNSQCNSDKAGTSTRRYKLSLARLRHKDAIEMHDYDAATAEMSECCLPVLLSGGARNRVRRCHGIRR